MMRIWLESHESHLLQVVDDPLYVLAIGTEISSQPRNRLRTLLIGYGTEYFPTRTRQPEIRHQAVAFSQQEVIESKQIKDKVGHRLCGRSSLTAAQYLSPFSEIDIMMSIRYQCSIVSD